MDKKVRFVCATSVLAAFFSAELFLFSCRSPHEPRASSIPSGEESESPSRAQSFAGENARGQGDEGTKGAGNNRPSFEEAKAFMGQIDRDLRRLGEQRSMAAWVSQNFITDDTEKLAARSQEVMAEYMSKAIAESRRFDALDWSQAPAGAASDLKRQFDLLRLGETVPSPSNESERRELAEVQAQLEGMYGKGEYCLPEHSKLASFAKVKKKDQTPSNKGAQTCLKLDDLSRIIKTSRDEGELTEAWQGWHKISPPMKDKFSRYVELGNKGAREIGFADLGALWRSGYDMSAQDFEQDVERLWSEVRPLYQKLHCYVRMKLRQKYGVAKVPIHGKVPAHLFGNMWAQEWNNIFDLVKPYSGGVSLDVDQELVKQRYDAIKMVKLGENFFTSLGLDPLPESFWKRSLLTRPRDREVVCHASAWDVFGNNDLRIKMCIEPTEDDLITVHHELGHNYYYHHYYKMPVLFQQGANDGFHEGIGDTLALSVTPSYLKDKGLLREIPNDEKGEINVMMKQALEKVAFLPFGFLIDKWRWDVFSGKVSIAQYNQKWWELREAYQGIQAPVSRSEEDFDPGAKYHVPASTPYMRYFLARIYQFQFYKALCDVSGHKGPLHRCSFYGSKAAGDKLREMLELGASKPWPFAMKKITGQEKADVGPLLDYFSPLQSYLTDQTKSEQCGW